MNAAALLSLFVVLAIGIAAGVALRTYRSRLAERGTIRVGAGTATYSLIGIAGAFIGFHMSMVLGLPSVVIPYLAAGAGALLTVIVWRGP